MLVPCELAELSPPKRLGRGGLSGKDGLANGQKGEAPLKGSMALSAQHQESSSYQVAMEEEDPDPAHKGLLSLLCCPVTTLDPHF